MTAEAVKIDESSVRKLLGAANPDAALLYIFISSGNQPEAAEEALHLSSSRLSVAAATLRQLGLWPEERKSIIQPGERPNYSEADVVDAMEREESFRGLYQEIQRMLGRNLNTEELKIILGFTRYLGLSADVIQLLVSFCCGRRNEKASSSPGSVLPIPRRMLPMPWSGISPSRGSIRKSSGCWGGI